MKPIAGVRFLLVFCFVLAAGTCRIHAQSNVRTWYANGQVWVVWQVEQSVLSNCVPTLTPALSNGVVVTLSNCLPQTYAIYWSPTPFTNTSNATLVGRLFAQEWSASILRDNVNSSFGVRPSGFRIPDGLGGYRVLATNEGVFVHTVRSNFAGHYAVRPFGISDVPPEWTVALSNAVFTLSDPPTCHLQAQGTDDGYAIEWWTMWADGDTNLAAARPDFPIMENEKRSGIPHNFSVTFPKVGSLPATDIPACIAFHSGDAQAKMWLPHNTGFRSVGLAPVGELLIAVEDRVFSTKNGVVDAESLTSTGYVPSFDPFFNHQVNLVFASPSNTLPGSNEVIVPFSLYRLNWTLDWLYANKNVDSNRVALVGHSGGAKGAMLWSHASPERFAAVGLYGPSLGQFPDPDARYIGTREQNLPLLLTNRFGQLVRALDIHEFAASYSTQRDLPFTRIFMGKREENWVLDDDEDSLADLGTIYRQSDALGLGAALFWDLRKHGMDTWTYSTLSNDVANPNNCGTNPTVNISGSWGIEDLWVPSLNSQYRRDDATNQIRHRADRSYPAFFNCARYGGHEDPGFVIYTNNSSFYEDNRPYDGLVTTTECLPPWTGDARGTWGGYFDWEPNITESPTTWSAVLYLVGPPSAFNPVEVCPDPFRRCDVAIRRPQQFQPATGTLLYWRLENAANGNLLSNGVTTVAADGLVAVPNVTVPRDPQRVRLTVSLPSPCAAPVLYATLTNSQVQLSWQTCPNYQYQVESSMNLEIWRDAGPPLAASTNGSLTWSFALEPAIRFFRVRADLLQTSPVPTAPGNYTGLLFTHEGLLRSYRLAIPVGYNAAVAHPLAMILHGHGQTADSFANLHPALFSTAQASNVILLFPDSTEDERGTGWNNADPAPGDYQVNDVGFLVALIDRISATLNIDSNRVYAGGFSSGGVMCHYLGARTTNVFAALASVEASIGTARGTGTIVTNPPAAGPMPMFILNCTNSCTRPYYGGVADNGQLMTAAIDAAYYWTNANLCAAAMTSTTNSFVTNGMNRFNNCDSKPPANIAQPNQVIIQRWGSCAPGAEVIFVTLTDGGHTWPDANDNLGFDANREVIRFFLRHQRP